MACSSTTIHPIFAPDHCNPSTSTHRYSSFPGPSRHPARATHDTQHHPSYIPPWHPFPQSMLFDRWPAAGPNATHVWPSSPPDFLLPYHHGALNPFYFSPPDASYPVARSDTSSSASCESPPPEGAQVVCTAPLVAPVPLPYHSPTFLQYDLPDDDEDLSHPPYTSRPHKRKRAAADDDDEGAEAESSISRGKRRALGAGWSGSGGGLPVRSTMQRPHRDAVLGRGARAF